MEKTYFAPYISIDTFNMYDYNTTDSDFMNNRLFATFTQQNLIEELISELSSTYTIMYKKMFVLFIKSTNDYVVTYNVEQGNINTIPENTILVHRKKDFNVLYSLNGLNEVIKIENNGIIDPSHAVDWHPYRNSILITNHGELKILRTKIYKIVDL
jgi:hypothetical protein